MEFVQANDAIHQHNLDLVALFADAPILLCPVVAGQTARVGHQGMVNGVETPFWAPFTGAFNLTRNPAGSVCAGFTADGMPVGLQVVGPQHADVAVLRTLAALEDLLDSRPGGADRVLPALASAPISDGCGRLEDGQAGQGGHQRRGQRAVAGDR